MLSLQSKNNSSSGFGKVLLTIVVLVFMGIGAVLYNVMRPLTLGQGLLSTNGSYQFDLPDINSYDFVIHWGDGQVEQMNTKCPSGHMCGLAPWITHRFPRTKIAQTYTVTIHANGTLRKASVTVTVPPVSEASFAQVAKQNTMPSPGTTQAPALQTPTPMPIDETANWKTYRNDKYGFEVKYPPTWDLPYPGDGDDIHLASSPVGEMGPKPGEVVVEIQAFKTKPSNIDLFSFTKSETAQPGELGPSGELTKTSLYGLSVIKIEHSGGEGPDGPGYYIEKSSDKFFYILVYGRTYEQIVNRIISTIKFIK